MFRDGVGDEIFIVVFNGGASAEYSGFETDLEAINGRFTFKIGVAEIFPDQLVFFVEYNGVEVRLYPALLHVVTHMLGFSAQAAVGHHIGIALFTFAGLQFDLGQNLAIGLHVGAAARAAVAHQHQDFISRIHDVARATERLIPVIKIHSAADVVFVDLVGNRLEIAVVNRE